MSTKITVLNQVYFKYLLEENEIIFIKFDTDLNYFFRLISPFNDKINDILSQNISSAEFSQHLIGPAQEEFHRAVEVLKNLTLISVDGVIANTDVRLGENSGALFKGQYFTIIYECLEHATQIHAMVNEGGPCSPQGSIQCGHDNYLYECIYDNTWAGLGTSC